MSAPPKDGIPTVHDAEIVDAKDSFHRVMSAIAYKAFRHEADETALRGMLADVWTSFRLSVDDLTPIQRAAARVHDLLDDIGAIRSAREQRERA